MMTILKRDCVVEAKLDLFDENKLRPRILNNFLKKMHTFLLTQIQSELQTRNEFSQPKTSSSSTSTSASNVIDQLFGSSLRTTTHCNVCEKESVRESRVYHFTLQCPTAQHVHRLPPLLIHSRHTHSLHHLISSHLIPLLLL